MCIFQEVEEWQWLLVVLLIEGTDFVEFERVYPGQGSKFDESWLQEKIYSFPTLINSLPGCSIDPIVLLCRELPLVGATARVYLDIFAVRKSGRPVLAECKLWRNPQARREVIGQVLEYGAIARKMSYSDVQAALRNKLQFKGPNPVYSAVSAVFPDVAESEFVDTFQSSLEAGSFDLVVAGDGIRSDVLAIGELLNTSSIGSASLYLLDVQVFQGQSGQVVLSPTVPLKTETIHRQVLIGSDSRPLETSSELNQQEEVDAPGVEDRKWADRAFWERFIDEVHFDHPEQSEPKHGGRNWVRLSMPEPITSITCYRERAKGGRLGIFFRLDGEVGARLLDQISIQISDLEQELGTTLEITNRGEEATIGISTVVDIDDLSTEDEQIQWLTVFANKMVNVFRPMANG